MKIKADQESEVEVEQHHDEPNLSIDMLWLQMGLDLERRSFELRGLVDDNMSAFTLRCLSKLTQISKQDPITIYLNSPGGSVVDGLAIYDLIRACPCHVTIIAFGQVGSMAPIIMVAGDTRLAFPNTRFMVHSPFFSRSSETSVDHHMDDAQDGIQLKEILVKILANSTKMDKEFWRTKITKQDYNFNLQKAKEYGIVTTTVKKKRKPRKK